MYKQIIQVNYTSHIDNPNDVHKVSYIDTDTGNSVKLLEEETFEPYKVIDNSFQFDPQDQLNYKNAITNQFNVEHKALTVKPIPDVYHYSANDTNKFIALRGVINSYIQNNQPVPDNIIDQWIDLIQTAYTRRLQSLPPEERKQLTDIINTDVNTETSDQQNEYLNFLNFHCDLRAKFTPMAIPQHCPIIPPVVHPVMQPVMQPPVIPPTIHPSVIHSQVILGRQRRQI